MLVSKMILGVRHVVLLLACQRFSTVWRSRSGTSLKSRLCNCIYSPCDRWMWPCHSSMQCFVLSCSCCSLNTILIIICAYAVIKWASSSHSYWWIIVINHTLCMGFAWCPEIVLVVSAVTTLKIITTLSQYRVF